MFRGGRNKDDFYEIRHPGEQRRHVFSELASKAKDYPPHHSEHHSERHSEHHSEHRREHRREHREEENSEKRPRRISAVKSALRNLTYRIIFSILIFTTLFFLLNWQSYSQIFKAKVDEWGGEAKTSTLQELIDRELVNEAEEVREEENGQEERKKIPFFINRAETNKTTTDKKKFDTEKVKLLKISKNPELERKNIPPLDMEVRPPDTRLVLPRINKNVPIVQVRAENLLKRDWNALEDDMMEALQYGIVHFPGTAMPGEHGNIALTGHSSYFPWAQGRFKDVFALLHEVAMGDQILLYHKQKKYIYEVTAIEIVRPDDINVLEPTPDDRLTLITCTPVGTDLKRLVVTAKLIKEA